MLFYHQERNHQGLDNKIIRPEFSPLPSTGPIRCRKRLGGMLNYYYREARLKIPAFEFSDSTTLPQPGHLRFGWQ